MKREICFLIALGLLLTGCATPSQPKTEITLVTSDDFTYQPSSITIPAGQPITLTIKNDGKVEHDFVIQKIDLTNVNQPHSGMDHDMTGMEYDLHLSAMPGESSMITFTPVEAGAYEFFCAVKGHKEAGMVGKMIVVNE